MRYRDLPDWASSLEAVKYLRPKVPAATWEAIGDTEAPEWLTFLRGANDLIMALARHQQSG